VVSNVSELPQVDFAVVAVPTAAHVETACALIERGTAILVEKPLAHSPDDARTIVETAERHDVVLAVGHIERFNPAVSTLARLVQQPRFMQFQRLSPYTPRITDSVVFDLMVHDLDIACLFAGAVPSRVSAAGVRVFSDSLDAATAVLEFPDGCVATILSSRMTQDKVRHIQISEPDRFLIGDCLRQDVSIKRETVSEYVDDDAGTYRQASVIEIPYLDRHAEPLAAELRNVIGAIHGTEELHVSGRAGLAAVELATSVEAACSRS
jgi:UDP-N-acetylglucosamine 3-dehydrogenase